MSMFKGVFFLLLAMLSVSLPAYAPLAQGAPSINCSIAESAIDVSSKLRRLSVLKKVPCKMKNRSEVERYLRETIGKKMPAGKLQNEGEVYRLLGLIPKDFDYINGIISIYTSQLGGYYDPEQKYYAMAGWMPEMMQMPIAVHELTHALQDQHFQLTQLIDEKTQTSDSLLARSALAEGDATIVMIDYTRELAGKPPVEQDNSVSALMMQNISGALLSFSAQQAPPAMQTLIIFPYISGLNFAHSLLKKGGLKEIDEAFRHPPNSTEEILHPEKYLQKKIDFVELGNYPPPDDVELKSPEALFSDRLGEFTVATLLGNWLQPFHASQAAAGWAGDRIALYERIDGKKLLTWLIRWDTPQEAQEFFSALSNAYTKRFGKPINTTNSSISFISPDFGTSTLTLNPPNTLLVINH